MHDHEQVKLNLNRERTTGLKQKFMPYKHCIVKKNMSHVKGNKVFLKTKLYTTVLV